nr:methyltransferase domain-containing protein [Candidatus Krumholzibacteriota bacterium]
MSNAPVTNDYLAASAYTDPVDKKKLRFVYAAVTRQAELRGVAPAELLLLDVACGVGGITLPLATFGGRVRAFDIDEADLSLLRERAVAAGFENILATREDALAFRDGREYDVIVASEVFEHLTHPDKLAENCARHLRRGGILVVTTPNGYGPWEMVNSTKLIPRRWNWLRRLVGKGPHDGAGREHEQRYTRGRLVAM